MLDKKMKEFNEISLNSEPVKEANRPAALQAWDSFKARSYNNAMTRIENPRNAADAWKAYKYNKVVTGQQERQSMADIDYFNPESITALGFGPSGVTYEQLMQLAYDGKIKITDPGTRNRLVVSWNPGWNASNYTQVTGAGRLGAGSMDQNTADKTHGLIDAMVEQKRTGTAAVYDYLHKHSGDYVV